MQTVDTWNVKAVRHLSLHLSFPNYCLFYANGTRQIFVAPLWCPVTIAPFIAPILNCSLVARLEHQGWIIHFQACRTCCREFLAITGTCQNPPCWKPWAIAQGFCSKSANLGPTRITRNPQKQSRKQLEIHLEARRRRFKEFGAISGKPAIAQTFCSNRPISDPCEFNRKPYKQSRKQLECISKHIGGVLGSLKRFPALTKIRHSVKTMG